MRDQPSIRSADGHKISAIHYKRNAPNLLIASHGITTEKTEDGILAQLAEHVMPPEFDTVIFDFRGHGDSPMPVSEVTVSGEILDLMAILRWAKRQEYQKISHLGVSFGASITLLAASVYDLKFLSSVVFWNPVVNFWNTFIEAQVDWGQEYFDQKNIEELSDRPFTKIPETGFFFSATMTQELLLMQPQATKWPDIVPLLILHGSKDTLVPFQDSQSYARVNQPNAECIILDDVDHGFDDKIDEAMKITKNWFAKTVT